MSTTDELASKLHRRVEAIDAADEGREMPPSDNPSMKIFNPYTEFKEFSRKEIQHYQKMFNLYDTSRDKFIDFEELKHMMEKLGSPQTHLALKEMIKEVDEDFDGKISFREFLLIFRKVGSGEIHCDGLVQIYAQMKEIDVDKEGVKGAKTFFETKVAEVNAGAKYEQEIKDEQAERKKLEEEKKIRKAEFKNKATFFQQAAQQ